MELSIIVPVYNAEKYLSQCLESLVALEIQNYEIILINDGSTDGSQDIMDRYTAQYPHLIKSFTQKNSGVSCARNFGMSQASGKYIGFVDSDDYILPEIFAKFWNEVKNTNLDVAVANLERDYDGKIVPDDLSPRKRCRLEKMETVTGQKYMAASYNYLKDDLKVEPITKLYKRAFLGENCITFLPGIRFEDTLFVIQVFLCAQQVRYFDYNFYRYRMHQQSFMYQKIGVVQIQSLWAVTLQMYAQMKDAGTAQCAYHSLIVSFLYLIYRYEGIPDKPKVKMILKETGAVTPKALVKKMIMLYSLR